MKPYALKLIALLLLLGALSWACRKENEQPDDPGQSVAIPRWDVDQKRTIEYAVEFRGYTKGALAQTRSTTLTLIFEGEGKVTAVFADGVAKHAFLMDTTGALTPLQPDKPYSPILDLLAQIPPDGLKEVGVGSRWDVLTPSEQQVKANAEACIIQSRRTFAVRSANADTVWMEQNGYLRVFDNKAAEANFEAMFGTAGGALARKDWTQWRLFQTGETMFSTADNCLLRANYTAVILPGPNMDNYLLIGSPEREELTIRRRP